jgi:hypothetical protein
MTSARPARVGILAPLRYRAGDRSSRSGAKGAFASENEVISPFWGTIRPADGYFLSVYSVLKLRNLGLEQLKRFFAKNKA